MGRVVTFEPDGQRKIVAAADVVAAWRRHSTLVPASYALGTAQHETDFTLNERDVEESGYVSLGLYQVGAEEMAQVGMPLATHDPFDLEIITLVMVDLAEVRLRRIADAAWRGGWATLVSNPGSVNPDVWAYLALAHNQGLGACLKTIAAHGLDWAAYKARNPQLEDMAAYGDDCVSGGAQRAALAGGA
jgi:hypothetical protein